MRSSLLFLLLCLTGSPLLAQDQVDTLALQLTVRIEGKFLDFATDKLQHVYTVSPTHDIVKFLPDGQSTFLFSNNTLGRLGHIDATNPFHILLFYPEFQFVVTLDRTLSEIGRFNLFDLNLLEVEALGMSNDNFIWVYDQINFRLKKLDREGELQAESDNLALLFPRKLEPNFLIARDNRVYLNSPELGVLVFDNFGQFLNTIALEELEAFQILNNRLFFRRGQRLEALFLENLALESQPLPAALHKARKLQLQKDLLYALFPDHIAVYRMK